MSRAKVGVLAAFTIMLFLGLSQSLTAQFRGAQDPGVRGGPDGAGDMLPNLTAEQQEMFTAGQADFSEEEEVDEGVGPRFNFVSCAGCHAQPAVGGSSPAANPLFRVNDPADLKFVNNTIPSFITKNGPVREARFQFNADGSRDGGVHALFVISGHPDAAGCNIRQENFETQVQNRNIVFRGPHARVRRRIDREHHRRRDHGQPGLELLGQEQPGHQRAPQSKRQRRAHRSCRAQPAATSSGPRRCGASASACSSCTTVAPTTSRWRSGRTGAAATRSSGRRRPTGSSTTTTG